MKKTKILLRLFKEGHINEEEFELLQAKEVIKEYLPCNCKTLYPYQSPYQPTVWYDTNTLTNLNKEQ